MSTDVLTFASSSRIPTMGRDARATGDATLLFASSFRSTISACEDWPDSLRELQVMRFDEKCSLIPSLADCVWMKVLVNGTPNIISLSRYTFLGYTAPGE